jgi:methyl-accepting chemotaxis protein
VYLIRKITDQVTYHSRGGVNELRMIKYYPRMRQTMQAAPRGMSLRVKFSLWTSLVMTAIIISVYLYWENKSVSSLRSQFNAQVVEETATIASQASSYFLNRSSDVEFDEFVHNFVGENRDIQAIAIVASDGRVVASSSQPELLHREYRPPPGVDHDLEHELQQITSADGSRIAHIIKPVSSGSRTFGHAHVSFSEAGLNQSITAARRGILFVVGAAFVFSMFAVYLLAVYFVKPIQKLIDGVRRFGRGDLEGQIEIEGAGEFSAIAEAFNEMTVKVKEAQENLVEQEKLRKEMQVAQDID